MQIHDFDKERHLEGCHRVLDEVGWRTADESNREANYNWLACAHTRVAVLNGEVECLSCDFDGTLDHTGTEVPMTVVGAVATGRAARGSGLATRLTAESVARDIIERGATLAALGVFDQGFYDRLGFGSGPPELVHQLDPRQLRVDRRPRPAERLGPDDYERIHTGRLARRKVHGSCCILEPRFTRGDTLVAPGGFGLGYTDGETGALSHHLWVSTGEPGAGPYRVLWMAWSTREQLHELLGLLHSLGDQVRLVRLHQPEGVPLLDLVDRPFQHKAATQGGAFPAGTEAMPWWQMRICDLPAAIAASRCDEEVEFHLELTDPIGEHLSRSTREAWGGIGGRYTVCLGPESEVITGFSGSAPAMRADVGAFTRWWLGVARAEALALTANLEAPAALLRRLDDAWRLPQPTPGWSF